MKRLECIISRTISHALVVDFVEDGRSLIVAFARKETGAGDRIHRTLTDEQCADLELFLAARRERLKRRDLENTPVEVHTSPNPDATKVGKPGAVVDPRSTAEMEWGVKK
jgi:hypothetical protein